LGWSDRCVGFFLDFACGFVFGVVGVSHSFVRCNFFFLWWCSRLRVIQFPHLAT
jgi:hypothetical protein